MPSTSWLLYGAYGYTGELIAREAARRGYAPILAGRRQEPLRELADALGFEAKVLDLNDPASLRAALEPVSAVLHAAGPFVQTSRPMVDACLATATHYLDITGEMGVFESVLHRAEEAREAGVALLPGAGFDVVPSDCLAAALAQALPDATHLDLAFTSDRGSASRGTLRTAVEAMPHVGAERRDGKIIATPLAHDARRIEFGCGSRWGMTIPWGDVSTAFHTTGIPNIRVYTGTPERRIRQLRRLRPLLPLVGTLPVKRLLQWWIGRTVVGPDAETRSGSRVHLWGEVRNKDGARREATLEVPEGYTLTASAAVELTARAVAGALEPGAWTPAGAFGPDLIAEIPGVEQGVRLRDPQLSSV
jgi:short subunit dehydrogenase-like uncharacterized protein